MEKTTTTGIIYDVVTGLGIIKDITLAEIPTASENDNFINIQFSINVSEENEAKGDFVTRINSLGGIDEDILSALQKGLSVRTYMCLVNAANFPANFFENCMKEQKKLPFTGVSVSVASMLTTLGYSGRRVVNTNTGNAATQHKRGFLGFVDNVSDAVLSICDNLRENLNMGTYIIEEVEQPQKQQPQKQQPQRQRLQIRG